jgi:hypothetical protein
MRTARIVPLEVDPSLMEEWKRSDDAHDHVSQHAMLVQSKALV